MRKNLYHTMQTFNPNDRADALADVQDLTCTVYIGRLPRGFDVNHLHSMLASAGHLRHVVWRENYCFAEYSGQHFAWRALEIMSGYNVRGNRLTVLQAGSLKRLFIGNLPRTMDGESIATALREVVGEGLEGLELTELSSQEMSQIGNTPVGPAMHGHAQSPTFGGSSDSSNHSPLSSAGGSGMGVGGAMHAGRVVVHRGFCFAQFRSHSIAHHALRMLLDRSFASRLYGVWEASLARRAAREHGRDEYEAAAAAMAAAQSTARQPLRVDWAEPLPEAPPEVMQNVRTLYVSNLPPTYGDASEGGLTALFSSVAMPGGKGVERVKRQKNYAFVHFFRRQDAEHAMMSLQNYSIAGYAIKIQWCKPPTKPAGGAPASPGHGFGGYPSVQAMSNGYGVSDGHHAQQQLYPSVPHSSLAQTGTSATSSSHAGPAYDAYAGYPDSNPSHRFLGHSSERGSAQSLSSQHSSTSTPSPHGAAFAYGGGAARSAGTQAYPTSTGHQHGSGVTRGDISPHLYSSQQHGAGYPPANASYYQPQGDASPPSPPVQWGQEHAREQSAQHRNIGGLVLQAGLPASMQQSANGLQQQQRPYM